MEYFIGLDIGGTKCAVVLAKVDSEIKICKKVKFPTEAGKGFAHTKTRLFQAVRDILKKSEVDLQNIRAIGVSCGGPLDSEKGLILSPPNLPGWDNVPFAEMLENEFGIPAFLQNDANACALVEWKLGNGYGTKNMVFFTMGTGMGAGIIAENQLLYGASNMCGESGHIRLAVEGPIGFGKAGSFEGFCSGAGIGHQARDFTRQWIRDGQTPAWIRDGLKLEEITAKVIADYAKAGDEQAKSIYRHIGRKLGEGLSIIIDVINPEKIVIGSIFTRSGELMREEMEKAIADEALIHARKACEVVPARFDEDLGDLASIMAACHSLGIDLYPAETEEAPEVLAYYDSLFERYSILNSQKVALMHAYTILVHCFRKGSKLLVCGNGGSAADADHIVGELMKGFNSARPLSEKELDSYRRFLGDSGVYLQQALPAVALTQHTALSTAFANDVAADMVFAQQLYGLAKTGDVLLAITTSGSSGNVVNAASLAKAMGMKIIALTGPNPGLVHDIADVSILAPGGRTSDIQELHLPIYHTLCAMLEEKFFNNELSERERTNTAGI